MASTTGWDGSNYLATPGKDQSLNNSSSFNALPVGTRYRDGSFGFKGVYSTFWTSTEYTDEGDAIWAWYRDLEYNSSILGSYRYGNKRNGFSVRFVRD